MTGMKFWKNLSITILPRSWDFILCKNIYPGGSLAPLEIYLRFFNKIFKNSARLRTYVGGSEFLCIYFIFSVLSNKTGQKLIWVPLLIRRFIEYRCHFEQPGIEWFIINESCLFQQPINHQNFHLLPRIFDFTLFSAMWRYSIYSWATSF